ncbi:MAG: GIDE domain-containing protein [Patescibacteria group bacterium]|jgi:hypothetical protein
MFIGGIIAVVLAGVLLFAGSRQKKMGSEMQKTKVVPIKDVSAGTQVEIEGTIACASPLRTPYSQRDCIAYEYTVEREERTTDPQGRPRIHWQNVSSDRQSIPFTVQDASGNIEVHPDHASLDLQDFGLRMLRAGDLTDNSILKVAVNVLGNNTNTRVREKALLVGSHAYVFGSVVQDAAGLHIGKGDNNFVISYKTEAEIERSKARLAMGMTILGIILGIAGITLAIYSFIK